MTVEDAMKVVRGMIQNIRYEQTKPRQRDFMHEGGFYWILPETPSGIAVDKMPYKWTLDEEKLPNLIEKAKADQYALDAVEDLARMHLSEGKPLPNLLAKFVLDWMDTPPKRKRKENPQIRARDEFVAMLVGYLEQNAGVCPTRNVATEKRESGCDRVVEAYQDAGKNLTYNAAEDAWKLYGRS